MSDIQTVPTQHGIEQLKQTMLGLPQAEFVTNHYYLKGVYVRELLLPKGALLVGRVHKKEHIFMLTKGSLSIASDGALVRLYAPCILVSKPGMQRAGYAHEDSICVTVHRTDAEGLEAIENDIAEPAPDSPYTTGNLLKQQNKAIGELS